MEVAAGVPVKLKQQKPSAFRDWPRGCGSLAIRGRLHTSESDPVEPSQSEDVSMPEVPSGSPALPPPPEASSGKLEESVGLLEATKPEPVKFVGTAEAVKPVDMEASKGSGSRGPEAKEEGKEILVFPGELVKFDQPELSDALKTLKDAPKHSYLRKYPPSKRRRISAFRDFPVGCGRNVRLMSDEEKSEATAVSQQLAVEGQAKSVSASFRSKRLEAGEKTVAELAYTEMVCREVKRTDAKHYGEKAQEISGEAQVKSASKSSMIVNTVEERREKKLEGLDVKQISSKDEWESWLSLDTRPQSGGKVLNKEAGSSVQKLVIKGPMKLQSDAKIIQRKSGVFGSSSFVPKSVKKEEKSLSKKISFKGVSISSIKSDMDAKDEKGLIVYKESFEMSINVTPLAPPNGEIADRNKVKRALRLFQMLCWRLLQGKHDKLFDLGPRNRIDMKSSTILKENDEWVNTGKQILGHVPGIEIGDEFHYRVELCIVGLHRQYQAGIDFVMQNGTSLATSIVCSGGYPDDMDSSDVLIYTGSGGNIAGGKKQPGDQKLKRGNLALKNSIYAQTPVRVIYGSKEKGSGHDERVKIVSTFTYDGLYKVESYRTVKGPHNYSMFKFQLRRLPGQPELALKEVRRSLKAKAREGLCIKDVSEGKESMRICAVNTVDGDRPMPFKYTTKNIYPPWHIQTPPRGCGCTDRCLDSAKCACTIKNGGEIPFNYSGAIMQAKPLVYECGPSCKCPPSCYNRVSQHGIKIPLEIFKTKSRGWGVRSLNSIPSGSFICEYIGEMLNDLEAERRSNDEYLFDIGHNYEDKTLWEGLPSFMPGLQPSSACETVEDVGFTIDAAEYGNVGRFINHSCSPNLYAQNVLYDHDDKRMPHIMLFAAGNLPPLQELTYHYNYTVDQVHDLEGNIKRKNCYCGSHECTGRLY